MRPDSKVLRSRATRLGMESISVWGSGRISAALMGTSSFGVRRHRIADYQACSSGSTSRAKSRTLSSATAKGMPP